jgi:hypothetical protein
MVEESSVAATIINNQMMTMRKKRMKMMLRLSRHRIMMNCLIKHSHIKVGIRSKNIRNRLMKRMMMSLKGLF